MTGRISRVYIGMASPMILLCFLVGGTAAELLFTVLVMGYPVALIALAVARDRGLGPVWLPLAVLLVILEGSGVAMLLLRGRVLDGPWFGGLPGAAAVLIYGLWLAPLPLVALAYALTFDRFELRREDLERLEARRAGNGQARS